MGFFKQTKFHHPTVGTYFPVSKSKKFSHWSIFNHMPLTNGLTIPVDVENCCSFAATPSRIAFTIHDSPDPGVDFTVSIGIAGVISTSTYSTPEAMAQEIVDDINGAVTIPDFTARREGSKVIIESVGVGDSAPSEIGNSGQITFGETTALQEGTRITVEGNKQFMDGNFEDGVAPCCIEKKIHSIPPASLNGPFFKRKSVEHVLG